MNKKSFPKGLSLIEMLVVVIIITLVMSIGGTSYLNQRKFVTYNNGISKILYLIKTARNNAVTSHSVYDACKINEADKNYAVKEGYGVYIERSELEGKSRVVLFANTKADTEVEKNQYNENADTCNSDLVEEVFYLPKEIDFIGLFKDKADPVHTDIGGSDPNKAVIIFRAPIGDASIAVNDHATTRTYLEDLYLEFRHTQANISAKSNYIHFNHIAGFPEIENE